MCIESYMENTRNSGVDLFIQGFKKKKNQNSHKQATSKKKTYYNYAS